METASPLRPTVITAVLVIAIAIAGCGRQPSTTPDPQTGGRHCGTIHVRGASAWPAPGTAIDAETCLATGFRLCKPGTDLVVFDMGVDTSDTTTYTVDAAPCRLAVGDVFFSANFGGNQTTTAFTCRSASVSAGGLLIAGCTSMNGASTMIPKLVPAPTPAPTPMP